MQTVTASTRERVGNECRLHAPPYSLPLGRHGDGAHLGTASGGEWVSPWWWRGDRIILPSLREPWQGLDGPTSVVIRTAAEPHTSTNREDGHGLASAV